MDKPSNFGWGFAMATAIGIIIGMLVNILIVLKEIAAKL